MSLAMVGRRLPGRCQCLWTGYPREARVAWLSVFHAESGPRTWNTYRPLWDLATPPSPLCVLVVVARVGVHCATSAFRAAASSQLLVTNVRPVVDRSAKGPLTHFLSSTPRFFHSSLRIQPSFTNLIVKLCYIVGLTSLRKSKLVRRDSTRQFYQIFVVVLRSSLVTVILDIVSLSRERKRGFRGQIRGERARCCESFSN